VQVARAAGTDEGHVASHTSDILFTFVLSGSVTLAGEGQGAHTLGEGDAYVVPPDLKTSLTRPSADLELLEVSLPARFETRIHPDTQLS
jgi:quercetin dioxygenase-like cupin family protein